MCDEVTAWKVSNYGVISGPYFPVFGPETTPYLGFFHAVGCVGNCKIVSGNSFGACGRRRKMLVDENYSWMFVVLSV